MPVIGTAGHVDHGKSTLIKALSGIDPDRLREEKERGMTIDLGFAWLKLPSGQEVGIVDVPGHERFIKNMLAGVGAIDLALLVVAADEGVMPQTKEHLAILDLLQIKRGIVVIAKRDLVDQEMLELVSSEVEDLLKPTHLSGSPIMAVSALTGEGLTELVSLIAGSLEGAPSKRDIGRPRLPIDRVFTIAGFGTVVTGTLVDGRFRVGQEVAIVPGGARARIRGLQTHRQRLEEALPGSRVAINLVGPDKEELQRGDVVASPGWLKPSTTADFHLRVLADAPHGLAHNTEVSFHTGSSEVLGRVLLLDRDEIPPGESGWAQIRLANPVAIEKGDYFILRSPSTTLGGGIIVAPQARRHRRYHQVTLDTLKTLESGDPQEIVLQTLEANEPSETNTVISASHLPTDTARSALERLVADGEVLPVNDEPLGPRSVIASKDGWQRLSSRTKGLLAEYHRRNPLRLTMPKEELRTRLKLTPRLFADCVGKWIKEGELAEEGAGARLASHYPTLTPAQQTISEGFLKSLSTDPYAPPTDLIPEPQLLNFLVESRQVIKVAENVVFSAAAYDTMVQRIVQHLREHGRITVAEVRNMFNTSRKYALALMEYLDQERITRRIGDERVLH